MNEDQEAANTALLLELDKKIEERIHIAVGKLFGFDVTKNYWMPAQDPTSLSGQVRHYISSELMREFSRAIANSPEAVSKLYDNMLLVDRKRRFEFHNRTNTEQQFF